MGVFVGVWMVWSVVMVVRSNGSGIGGCSLELFCPMIKAEWRAYSTMPYGVYTTTTTEYYSVHKIATGIS